MSFYFSKNILTSNQLKIYYDALHCNCTIIVSTLCLGAEVVPGSPGSGPVFLQELSCSDNDTHILNCNRYVPSHSLIIFFFWCKFPLF